MTTAEDIFAAFGTSSDALSKGSNPLAKQIRANGIQRDAELERVLALPRREGASSDWIEALSRSLCPGGTGRLREPQAVALRELWECGGAFLPMRVGSGKTLVTLLAATLLTAQRPVLMIPASLREKTRREFVSYRDQGWNVRLPVLVSYQEMGRPDRESRLFDLDPDLLILDEAQGARNVDAAVTRRVRRFVAAQRPRVVVMSGTLMTDRLRDYHHLAVWSLGLNCPAPLSDAGAERWSRALDKDTPVTDRVDLGALRDIPGGFHEWFRGSKGVVPTPGSDCDASIEISSWSPDLPDELRKVIAQVETTKERPDEEPLDDWELADCLSQLALGFFYRWDPMPPQWWLDPRRGWTTYVRSVLEEHLDGFDSTGQIVNALDRGTGLLPPAWQEGRALLAAWRQVRDRFAPNPVPEWISTEPLVRAAHEAGPRCLVWTRYRAAGRALEAMGVPYYPGGTNPEEAKGRTIALSISAHGTGRNLQAWDQNLVLTPPANAGAWEQLIGRTHRAGQTSDSVGVRIVETIEYHRSVMDRVVREAEAVSRASGFSQKLTDATWT